MRRCPDIKKAIVQLSYQPSIQLKEGSVVTCLGLILIIQEMVKNIRIGLIGNGVWEEIT